MLLRRHEEAPLAAVNPPPREVPVLQVHPEGAAPRRLDLALAEQEPKVHLLSSALQGCLPEALR